MPKYVLTPEYLAELKHFLDELVSEEQKTIITVYLRLCSDYINNTLSDKSDAYILPKSTAFIIRAKYGVRAHLFTRVFDNSVHYNKARSLGILSFDAGLWEAMKDKQVGQSYEFSVEAGKKPQRGQIHYRTKSAKQKHRLHPDELHRIAKAHLGTNKQTKHAKQDKYKTYKFILQNSSDPVFYKKRLVK